MGEHSKALTKNKFTRRSSPFQENGQFPPLVDISSESRQSTRSSSKSSRSSGKIRTRSVSSAVSSLSSSTTSSSSRANSRASSGYSTLSSRSSLSSGKSNHSNLDVIFEELDDCKSDTSHHHRLLSGALGESRGDPHSPPPSRVLTGAHYLKWYIPPHIAGSRALNRSAKSATAKHRINKSSPLHNSEKQAWLNKLIDPKGTSLPLPAPHKSHLPDHSKTAAKRADNIQQAFSKYQIDTNSSNKYFSNSYSLPKHGQHQHPPSSFSQIKREPPSLKSLLLEHDKQAYSSTGDQLDPLSTSFFTNSQLPVQSWFIVNPEWRKEPGKR